MGPSTSNTNGNFKCKKESVGEATPTPSDYEMMYIATIVELELQKRHQIFSICKQGPRCLLNLNLQQLKLVKLHAFHTGILAASGILDRA